VLVDEVCVIAGAGQGIKPAVAIKLARRGATPVPSGVSFDKGNETVRPTEKASGKACYIPCAVRQRNQVQALMDGAGERYGRIDVLISNAGAHESALATDTRVDLFFDVTCGRSVRDQPPRHVAVHQVRPAPLDRAGDRERRVGRLVRGLSHVRLLPGDRGRHAHLTKATATDLAADRIPCNCVCPGPHEPGAALELHEAAETSRADERRHRNAARRTAGPVGAGCQADPLPGLLGRGVHHRRGLPSRRRRPRLARHTGVRIGHEMAVAGQASTSLSAYTRPTRPHSSRRCKHTLRSSLTSRFWLAEVGARPADRRRPLRRRPLAGCVACKCWPSPQA
jgi:NAD(P)-dependent dehydrogenase (short-subunit alcohol dehydrogenase family)